MIALRVPVFAVVVPEGGVEARRVHGRVVGRTWEQSPRYDVLSDDGITYRNLCASVIELPPAANAAMAEMPHAA